MEDNLCKYVWRCGTIDRTIHIKKGPEIISNLESFKPTQLKKIQ